MIKNYLKYIFLFCRGLDKKAIAFSAIAFLFLFFGAFSFEIDYANSQIALNPQDSIDQKRAKLEAEIARLRQEIADYKNQIGQKEGEKKTITKEVNLLNSKISALQFEIQATELEVENISGEIRTTEEKIKINGQDLARKKEFLKELIRAVYVSQDKSVIEVLIQNDRLSDFMGEFQKLNTLNYNVKDTIDGIKTVKQNLEKNKSELEDQQDQKSNLLDLKENQKQEVQENKKEKETILKVTVKEQAKLKTKLSEGEKLLPAMIAQLKSLQLFGKPINFDDAKAAAKFASSVTGVRPAFLLGILKVESNLGSNVGTGYYKKDMKPDQHATFLQITSELGLDPDKMPVSKKPASYSGWGGAMGPAQMMPKTWMGYRARVTSLTGDNPPNPWDLKDAMTAMALYVSNVSGVTARNANAEYEAAARYFAGGNWKKFTWYARNSGGTGVMDWAERYEILLNGG